jgi:molybdopterin synthase catalytic subunit
LEIRVQEQDFDLGHEVSRMRAGKTSIGAIAAFVGLVRDINEESGVSSLTLEHYPGMTEKSLANIADEAARRWQILDATIIHRIGELHPTDQIVLVAVASSHRGDAFSACEFIMDYLKTKAPFWKREEGEDGVRWVDARDSDEDAAKRWKTPDE